jgi:Arc/MetJ-type ribon-helix-helix transcriptional regulator
MVEAGAYPSADEALDAAVAAVETAAAPAFEGTPEELTDLVLEGLNSGEPVAADADFWDRVTTETERILKEQKAKKPHS